MNQLVLALLLSATVPVVAAAAEPVTPRPVFRDKVLKVEVTHGDGSREIGSAVPLAGDKLITNCHTVHDVQAIRVVSGARAWLAQVRQGDAYRDLCFLDAPGFGGAALPTLEEQQLRVGMTVYAVGYSGGNFAVSEGQVKGLHLCPCDGGRVIQTSARFDRGASGGGLFDGRGRLVGILSFKSGMGGNFHFALPVGWLRALAKGGEALDESGKSFWEQSASGNVYFLAACALGAKESWEPLSGLAQEWTAKEPDNPEAWMSLGRARAGLGLAEEAVLAFRRVLQLDSTHDEAIWELQKLEMDLGIDLLSPDGRS